MNAKVMFGMILAFVLTIFIRFYGSADPIEAEFQAFIIKYKRNYATINEYEFRKHVFKENLEFINNFNAQKHSWFLGINKFADMTDQESDQIYANDVPKKDYEGISLTNVLSNYSHSEDDIDWRLVRNKYIHKTKNQLACGSCWAFATNAAVQTAWVIYNEQKLQKDIDAPDLSEQHLVDCETGSYGCNSGYVHKSMNYYLKNSPKYTKDYQYNAVDGYCKANNTSDAIPVLKTWYQPIRYNDRDMRFHLNYGVLTVDLRSVEKVFKFYAGGVIGDSDPKICGYKHTHDVTLVASYTEPNGSRYWVLQNSWGEEWGEKGFVRIARKSNYVGYKDWGVCGINDYAILPSYIEYN